MSLFQAVVLALAAALLASPTAAQYTLVNDYSGASFFDGWTFFTGTDPTAGFVNYTDYATAQANNYIGFTKSTGSLNAYMGVDHTTRNPATGRNSVRISSNASFSNGALVIADFIHTPLGIPGVWPAYWLLGPDWPNQGEVDIIEGVNGATHNQMTLHTSSGCGVDSAAAAGMLGTLSKDNCDVAVDNNTGCGIVAPDTVPYSRGASSAALATGGTDFNSQGGGVYALDWTAQGFTIWLFSHSSIPADILSGRPDPRSWTQKPLARFSGAACSYYSHFRDLSIVLNTDFCGSWAGKAWPADGSAATTGVNSCNAFVADNPQAFVQAYWEIASIRVYQQQGGTDSAPGRGERVKRQTNSTLPSLPSADHCADVPVLQPRSAATSTVITTIRTTTITPTATSTEQIKNLTVASTPPSWVTSKASSARPQLSIALNCSDPYVAMTVLAGLTGCVVLLAVGTLA